MIIIVIVIAIIITIILLFTIRFRFCYDADTTAMDNGTLRWSGKSPACLQQPAHETQPQSANDGLWLGFGEYMSQI